jgi:hypothetical protein
MKIAYGQIKTTLAKVLNLTASDPRVLNYCNRAVERLLYDGMFVGTTFRYRVCVSERCLVWPREVETILAAWMCNSPMTIRGSFYEALENGPGLSSADGCGPCLTLQDRDNSITFDWVTETGYKLAIYADGTEAAGNVLIRYFDVTGNKVYTGSGVNTIEGENFAIPAAGNYTIGTYEVLPYGVYHVQKPSTFRTIRLYARKISDGSLKPLSYYEADETLPVYRASLVSHLNGGSCDSTQITIEAKQRFIPATNDSSVLIISHTEAIRLAVQAVKKEEDNQLVEAANYWVMARECLNSQLRHHRGSGQVDPIRFASSATWGGGSVINIV